MESELSLRVGGVEVSVKTGEAATNEDRRLAAHVARLMARLLGPPAPEVGRVERLRAIIDHLIELNAIPDRIFRAIALDVEGISEEELEHWRSIDPRLAAEAASAIGGICSILYDDVLLDPGDVEACLEERNEMRRQLVRLIEALTALEVRRGASA